MVSPGGTPGNKFAPLCRHCLFLDIFALKPNTPNFFRLPPVTLLESRRIMSSTVDARWGKTGPQHTASLEVERNLSHKRPEQIMTLEGAHFHIAESLDLKMLWHLLMV